MSPRPLRGRDGGPLHGHKPRPAACEVRGAQHVRHAGGGAAEHGLQLPRHRGAGPHGAPPRCGLPALSLEDPVPHTGASRLVDFHFLS